MAAATSSSCCAVELRRRCAETGGTEEERGLVVMDLVVLLLLRLLRDLDRSDERLLLLVTVDVSDWRESTTTGTEMVERREEVEDDRLLLELVASSLDILRRVDLVDGFLSFFFFSITANSVGWGGSRISADWLVVVVALILVWWV
jgi:hypothetical protein